MIVQELRHVAACAFEALAAKHTRLPLTGHRQGCAQLFYTMAVGYTLCSMHVSHGIASSLDVADCTDDDDDF